MTTRRAAPDEGVSQLPPANYQPLRGGEDGAEGPSRRWGAHLSHNTPEDRIRIGFLNIGGFPNRNSDPKNVRIRDFLVDMDLDVILLSETNLAWHKLPYQDRLFERTRDWWESRHVLTGYYKDYQGIAPKQPGGTAIITTNNTASRILSSGQDTTGLGRWTWVRYRGREGITLRVISAYRPTLNRRDALSTYNQQAMYFEAKDIRTCPRQLFVDDLCQQLQQWIIEGDQIVLALDNNEDVQTGPLADGLHRLNMSEAILRQFPHLTPPNTFQLGTKPIDSIFVTSTLLPGCTGGFSAFDESPSDHRMAWIELPKTAAFGFNPPQTAPFRARRLKLEDPRTVTKYLQFYKKFIHDHNLVARIFALENAIAGRRYMTPAQQREWEAIDWLRVKAVLLADRQCRHLRTGRIPHSPAYRAAARRIHLWNKVVAKLHGRKIKSRHLYRLAKKAGLLHVPRVTLAEAEAEQREAYRHYRQVIKQADSHRKSWKEALAQARIDAGLEKEGRAIQDMLRREKQRETARMIKRVNQKINSGAITMVSQVQPDGSTVEFTSKAGIERVCLETNEARFRQASVTPFLQSPMYEELGPLGFTLTGQFILNQGRLPDHLQNNLDIDPYVHRIVPFLKIPATAKNEKLVAVITTEDHIEGWKNARERTASGRSGLHFGHFKAGITDQDVAEFEAALASIPLQTGYSPERWKQTIEVMLEKKPGVHLAAKLRCIVLLEADFNEINKKLGRRMMMYGESKRLLAIEQYGSRHHRSAGTQCLNKRLTLDLLRQQRQGGILLSNDAKACYDRIVHSFASLAMQRVGVPVQMIECSFRTIQDLRHYIRTVYGESATYFGGEEWDKPVSSIGQGNGAGPAIWAVVSTPIFEMMRAAGHGAQFVMAITGERIMLVGFAFVDDTDLIVNSATHGPIATTEVLSKMQASLTDWEGGLRVTGGALEPSKSWWYLINFTWDSDGRWRYMTPDKCSGQLSVRDPEGQIQPLERVAVNQGRKTLGVYLAPDGNEEHEFDYLREAVLKWRDRIWAGHLPRHAAWESLHTTILKTIEYPLPVTCLTESQCNSLMQPLLEAGLPNSGIVRTLPHALVYGPLDRQGLGFPRLDITQGAAHLQTCLNFGHKSDDPTGFLLRASCQSLQLELGSATPFYTLDFQKWGKLATISWIRHTWSFLSKYRLILQTDLPTPSPRRDRDIFLMDRLVDSSLFNTDEMLSFNRCRLFLRVVTLADIMNAEGTKVLLEAWEGHGTAITNNSTYTWPNQTRPNRSAWDTWRRALTRLFNIRPGATNTHLNLGPWISSSTAWQWFYSHSDERLYEQLDPTLNQQWKWYPRKPGRPSRNSLQRYDSRAGQTLLLQETTLPNDLVRVTVSQRATELVIESISAHQDQHPFTTEPHLSTFVDYLTKSSPADNWSFQDVELIGLPPDVWLSGSIERGECQIVSDGSYKDGIAVAAIIIESSLPTPGRIKARCRLPGQVGLQDSYRGELGGLYGGCQIIAHAIRYFRITTGSATFGCDGPVSTCFDFVRHSATFPHHDLVMAIQKIMTVHNVIKWHFRRIKGHQDADPDAVLDRWAMLNIEADLDAKTYRCRRENDPQPTFQQISYAPWALFLEDGTKLLADIKGTLQHMINTREIENYWTKRGRFQQGICGDIDWTCTGTAMKSFPPHTRREITKHVSGFCGVNKQMHRWGQRSTNLCPRCKEAVEDAAHVWICPHETNIDTWTRSLVRFRLVLQELGTGPQIRDAILLRLTEWSQQLPHSQTSFNFPGLSEAIDKQDAIGWQAAFEGCWASEWSDLQEHYFRCNNKRNSGRRWLTAIIRKLWEIAWDLWSQRNNYLHQVDTAARDSKLIQDIRDEYSKGFAGFPSSTRELTRRTLQSILESQVATQQAWLLRIQAARLLSQQDSQRLREARLDRERRQAIAERSFMNRWVIRR